MKSANGLEKATSSEKLRGRDPGIQVEQGERGRRGWTVLHSVGDHGPNIGYSSTMCKEATGSFKPCPGMFGCKHEDPSGRSVEDDLLM